jgi:hypothetical protein
MKYFATKTLTGAILYLPDTNDALLFITVGIYRQLALVDPHFECPRVSYSPKYLICHIILQIGLKLIIGTTQCSYLITSSICIDNRLEPLVVLPINSFIFDLGENLRSVHTYRVNSTNNLKKLMMT